MKKEKLQKLQLKKIKIISFTHSIIGGTDTTIDDGKTTSVQETYSCGSTDTASGSKNYGGLDF